MLLDVLVETAHEAVGSSPASVFLVRRHVVDVGLFRPQETLEAFVIVLAQIPDDAGVIGGADEKSRESGVEFLSLNELNALAQMTLAVGNFFRFVSVDSCGLCI